MEPKVETNKVKINYNSAEEKRVNLIVKLDKNDFVAQKRLAQKAGLCKSNGIYPVKLITEVIASVLLIILTSAFEETIKSELLMFFSTSIVNVAMFFLRLFSLSLFVLMGYIAAKYYYFTGKHCRPFYQFGLQNDNMIIGFGKEDVLVRSKTACIKLPYSSIKKAKWFKDGLLIGFNTSQVLYIPTRFFSKESFSCVGNILNSCIGRRFHIKNDAVLLESQPQTVEPDGFIEAKGAPQFEIEYQCSEKDYCKLFFNGYDVSLQELFVRFGIIALIVVISYAATSYFIGSEAANSVPVYVCILVTCLEALGAAILLLSLYLWSKRCARAMSKWSKGTIKTSLFDNCLLTEYENGSWYLIPKTAVKLMTGKNDNLYVYSNRQNEIVIPLSKDDMSYYTNVYKFTELIDIIQRISEE